MRRRMKVVLENRVEELRVLTQMLQAFLRPYQMPSSTLYALELSLEEILVNIVSYAYEDEDRHAIQFEVEVSEETIGMTFVDDGRPFNPLAVEKTPAAASPAERGEGGLGISFVRHMRDMMEYQRRDDRNILRLWFQRDADLFGTQQASVSSPTR